MKKNDKFILFLKDIMVTIVIYIVVTVIFTQFFMRPFRVEGGSMLPNLRDKELGISSVFSLKKNGIERFDVVIVYQPAAQRYIVKRVIALPGETVRYEYDTLYINGEAVEEPFLNEQFKNQSTDGGFVDFTTEFGPLEMGEDEYFLLGDNRPRSSDSRLYGPFKRENIKSKNGYVLYPFNSIRKIGKN